MSRTVLALMAGLLCALAGAKYAASLKAEAARLARWTQLLRHISLLIDEGTLSMPQLLYTAADSRQNPDLILQQIAADIVQKPLTTLENAFHRRCPDWREKANLQRMFARLGHGSKESRQLAAEQSARELEQLALRASATAEKDVKLWQTLGFIGGTCLTILLL